MDIKIYPSKVNGEITIPPSKSMAHRAIICASLAHGTSKISNIVYSQDIKTTIEGMKKLGAHIIKNENTLTITGIKDFKGVDTPVNCNESGSTLRFFIPLFSLTGKKTVFCGKNRLLERPQTVYRKIFAEQGIKYIQDKKKIEIEGKLKSGHYKVDGNISSQFITGLLFILPLLDKDSIIIINPPFESKSYVDLTIEILSYFGIHVKFKDNLTIFIPGNQQYQPHDYHVEGDFSQLGFFAVLGSINNKISCRGVCKTSLQGDKKIIDIIKSAGGIIEELSNGYTFYPSTLKGIKINLEDCPDLGPVLMAMGALCKGNLHIFNAQRLRYKESDRIEAMESELRKAGVNIHSDGDSIYIEGTEKFLPVSSLYGHKDHRIVMSLSILATTFKTPVTITGAEAVEKSYPDFFKDLASLGVKIEKIR